MKIKKIKTYIVLTFFSIFLLTGCNQKFELIDNNVKKISVSAKEKVNVVPDKAEISFSVFTENINAEDCQKENIEKTNKVIAALKELEIEDNSIQTSNFSLTPNYDWSNNKKTLTGYSMETLIMLSNINIDKVGNILTKSVENGINNINNVSYFSSKYDEAYNQALDLAIKTAEKKANIMALSSNSKINGIININENYQNDFIKSTNYDLTSKLSMANYESGSVNIQPGELEVIADINIDYSIQ